MKLNKILEYLKTLSKVRRNFFSELSETASTEIDRAYAKGMADANGEHLSDLESVDAVTSERVETEEITRVLPDGMLGPDGQRLQ
jgi:hypothetical protein